ncbi:cytochrome P450 [Choiromyces venosus 120613-1]|uniref:Cytochrome P450 n=1 Tax=Choiromyces venosus 120613-1 TaxID=1336337 RepID=A0A3N4J0A7_9PEZI|nr:cytochrome P450 [Choiromyces venosus 120613-1]
MALDAVISYVREQAPGISRGTIASTVFVAWLVYRIGIVFYRLYLDPLSKFPGPKLAAATSLYEMYYDIVEGGTLVWKMDELHRKYGPIVRISPHSLRLRKSSAYHEIHRMGTPFTKDFRFYHLFGIPRSSFSTIDINLHRQRRSMLNPMFSRKGILDLEFLIKEKIELLCRRMKEHEVQDKIFNCHQAFAALTVDIVTEFAYAKSYDVLSTPDFTSRTFDAFDAQHEAFLVLKHFPLMAKIMQNLPFWILLRLMPDGAGFAELEEDAKVHLSALFDRIRTGTMEKNTTHRTIFEEILAEHPDPKNADPAELTDEAMSVVGAGIHTSRWALCVGLLEIARDPLIQTKLYEELKLASPDIDAEFSYLHCEKLPYLRGVILETLRLSYGVMGPLPRRVPRGGAVVGGYHLPGDSTIEMDNYSLHHDEDIFPDSRRFWPERWSTPESKQNEKFVNAFGAGPRQCLGINLAMCELYLSFATIFRRFEIDISARGTQRMKYKEHWMGILRDEPLKCKFISRKE